MFSSLRLRGIRFPHTNCVRFKSKSSGSSKRFSGTLNLPKTDFPATSKSGAALEREKQIQKVCDFDNLYQWQRSQNREKEFVLHDGPPYANGNPHVGHALNKILKDITNRYKLLKGYRVHFVPGWDCHGLPIEMKALKHHGDGHKNMEPLAIRKIAQTFAEEAAKVQRESFKYWGVMADWKQSCYYTFDHNYQAKELEVFYKMYEKGLVYEDFMPVYWSPSSGTALAESELEYNPSHVSRMVYVRFPVVQSTLVLGDMPSVANRCVYAVIWTTTPWTLPANQAICYSSELVYCILEDRNTGDIYICEKVFVEQLTTLLGYPLTVHQEVQGSSFQNAQYTHPLTKEVLPFLPAHHVQSGKGTGFVHTAPCHGHDDFKVATSNGLDIKILVDDEGMYKEEAGPHLQGKAVGKEADQIVIQLLKDSIIHQSDYDHSYPYDWRTKLPVIIRASKQWFVDTTKLKQRAMECLKSVEVLPKSSEHGMMTQLEQRPYWCISRQRVWGLPIPVFYHKTTGKPLINRMTIDHLKQMFTQYGSDCWWSMSEEQLLPKDLHDKTGNHWSEYTKGKDILDIWFDSGSSWSILEADGVDKADVYMEGVDQFGGWFQTSLLTSTALNDTAPYRKLVAHGFAIDEFGQKMSKSVGNVVDPDVVVYGGKDQNLEPSYGVDVLRWWSAHAQLQPKVMIGPSILQKCNEDIFKVRKVLRFVLGNLHNFQTSSLLEYEELWPQDRYILYQLSVFAEQVTNAYDELQYGKVLQAAEQFINVHLSSFYCNIIRDRMYCSAPDDKIRLMAQTVLYHVLDVFTKSLAPIAPHLAEELYHSMPSSSSGWQSVFKSNWYKIDSAWTRDDIINIMIPVLNMKEYIDGITTIERPVEYDLTLHCSNHLYSMLKRFQSEDSSSNSSLTEIMQTSHTHLTTTAPERIHADSVILKGNSTVQLTEGVKGPEEYALILMPASKKICERCRRYTADTSTAPCDRCMLTLASEWA